MGSARIERRRSWQTDAELEPLDAELHEQTAAAAQEKLTPERFTSEREEGSRLSLDEAVHRDEHPPRR